MKDVYKRNILVHIKKLSGIKLLGVTLGSNPTYWSLILTRSSNSSNMKIFLNLWSWISLSLILSIFFISEAGLVQWWECLPPINVARVRFLSHVICGSSLLLLLALLHAVFSRFSDFPPPTKNNISKFQFDQDRRHTWKTR